LGGGGPWGGVGDLRLCCFVCASQLQVCWNSIGLHLELEALLLMVSLSVAGRLSAQDEQGGQLPNGGVLAGWSVLLIRCSHAVSSVL
jgi:hypothetical protein